MSTHTPTTPDEPHPDHRENTRTERVTVRVPADALEAAEALAGDDGPFETVSDVFREGFYRTLHDRAGGDE